MTAGPVRPHIAQPVPYRCGAGREHCGRPARFHPSGWLCEQYTPAQQAGRDEPPTTPLERQR